MRARLLRFSVRVAALGRVGLVLFVAPSCAVEPLEPSTVEARPQRIVYGEDDRVDLYEVEGDLAHIARTTTIAVISPNLLQEQSDGSYTIAAPSYASVQSLCPGERFAEQPAAAGCSGVLVAPDLVATAGHCLAGPASDRPACGRSLYVLGFAQAEPSASITIASDDVFACKEVLARVKTTGSACQFDLALVRLDRPAARFASLRERVVEPGERLAVVGYPAGLPLKIDRGAMVIDARPEQRDFFTLNSDTFAVSSGSPIFDIEGALVGLFSRGRRDYDQEGSCLRVHREDEELAQGFEEATHAAAIQDLLDLLERDSTEAIDPDSLCSASGFAPSAQSASTQKPSEGHGGCRIGEVGLPSGSTPRLVWVVLCGALLARRGRREAPVRATARARRGDR